MAAPRVQQRGGATGLQIWLIAFVALWLVSTVLLVLLYTGQADLTKKNEDVSASNLNLSSETQKLESESKELASLAIGSESADPDAVRTQINDFLARIRNESIVPDPSAFADATNGLLPLTKSVYEALRSEHQVRQGADEKAAALQAEVDKMAEQKSALEQAFAEKEREFGERIQDLESAHARYVSDRDAEIDSFEGRVDQLRDESSGDIAAQRQEVSRLTQELADAKSRIGDFQTKFGELQLKPDSLMTARQVDGTVVSAKPGDEVVYINLGRRDRIVRGMQFAVYSAAGGIPADGQAKARIEVVTVSEHSSECMIREILGRSMILDGDLIANPIYDKSKRLRFVVAGTFDLNQDGRDDQAGSSAIKSMIQDWGGEMVDEVSARVDFVVLGNPPRKPAGPSRDDDPEEAARQELAQREYDEYTRVAEAAQALSVPILLQEPFLHFLGYAGNM
jgi:hypothetical protein